MDLNKRGRTRRKRESKKPEPRHDVNIANGIKKNRNKKISGSAMNSGKTMDYGGLVLHLVTLK